MNEVVSNAYKHAFPEDRGGRIEVRVSQQPQALRLEVRDDGTGLGVGHETVPPTSLGRRLVELLARQLGAEASWHADGGTVFLLILPAGGAGR